MGIDKNEDCLYVALGGLSGSPPSQGARGFGVRKVETAGKNRAVIVHTATGEHLRQLEALFQDVIEAKTAGVRATSIGDNQPIIRSRSELR